MNEDERSVQKPECYRDGMFDIDHSSALQVDRETDYGFFGCFTAQISTNQYTRHPKCTEIDEAQYLVQWYATTARVV